MDLHVYCFSSVTKVDLTALFLSVLNTFATQSLYTAFKESGDVTVKDAYTSWNPQFTFFQPGAGFQNYFLGFLLNERVELLENNSC